MCLPVCLCTDVYITDRRNIGLHTVTSGCTQTSHIYMSTQLSLVRLVGYWSKSSEDEAELLCAWWGSSSITQRVTLSVSKSLDQSHKHNQMQSCRLQFVCGFIYACVCTSNFFPPHLWFTMLPAFVGNDFNVFIYIQTIVSIDDYFTDCLLDSWVKYLVRSNQQFEMQKYSI